MSENIVLITKAFRNQMVIPAFDAFCEQVGGNREFFLKNLVPLHKKMVNYCMCLKIDHGHLLQVRGQRRGDRGRRHPPGNYFF